MTEPPQLLSDRRAVWARRALPLLVGLAVGIRLALALVHRFHFPDAADYDALARAMLEGRPYETGGNVANRMPGYPLLVAGVYAVAGYSERAVLVVQALLTLPIVLLTVALARRHGMAAALVGAALVTFDPLTVGFSNALLTETPFTLCLLMALWIGTRILERPTWGRWMALGVIWGVAVLIRASALWCIVPLALWLGFAARGFAAPSARIGRQRFLGPVIAIALTFALLTPWLVRNYRHFHSGPFRLTTLEGLSLYESVYPEADGGPRQHLLLKNVPPDMQGLGEAERNDEYSRRAWAFIRSDPVRMARLGLVKFVRTWSPWFNAAEMQNPLLGWGMTAWYVPLYVLALAGILMTPPRGTGGWRGEKALLLIPVVYFSLLHSLFLGSVRYRVPLMPVVCIFAAVGLTTLWTRVNSGKISQPSAEAPV